MDSTDKNDANISYIKFSSKIKNHKQKGRDEENSTCNQWQQPNSYNSSCVYILAVSLSSSIFSFLIEWINWIEWMRKKFCYSCTLNIQMWKFVSYWSIQYEESKIWIVATEKLKQTNEIIQIRLERIYIKAFRSYFVQSIHRSIILTSMRKKRLVRIQ